MKLTPTEQLIYDELGDGASHPKDHLILCLPDDWSEDAFRTHIYNLRKKLNPIGQDIVTEKWSDGICYRRARIVRVY